MPPPTKRREQEHILLLASGYFYRNGTKEQLKMNDLLTRLFHFQPSLLVTLTHDALHIVLAVLILVIDPSACARNLRGPTRSGTVGQ